MNAIQWRIRDGGEPFFARGEIPPLQYDELAKVLAESAGFVSVPAMYEKMGEVFEVDLKGKVKNGNKGQE